MIQRKTFSFLFFFLCAVQTNAQTSTTIKATVDKSKILIGEPFQLTIEVSYPSTLVIPFFEIDSINHFEFLQPLKIDSSISGDRKTIKSIYTLTSFDSGHWVIPFFSLTKKIKTDTLPVDVLFSEFNPQQDYHDIKDIIEVDVKEKKSWLWYVVAGSVLLLLLIYFLLKKKKQPAPVIAAPALNAYEDAMQQLSLLQKEKLSGKEFHTRLVDIFRLYVLRKKNILSLQKTTDDLVMQLRPIINSTEIYNQIQQALRLSDFVKFAKYIPAEEDNLSAFSTIKRTIEHIEQL